jgi:demethylmenaquinone methyltransferase/2-methoxy-6-polyprenyl-1,4-benzoquinol methylase
MANPFFQPGEQRAAQVQALFARVASRYDLLNDLQSFGLHRYWKRKVIELARPFDDARALDLCCGTGDLALAFARAGAEVVGLDFSAEMLAVARKKAAGGGRKELPGHESHGLNQPNEGRAASLLFLQGDAQHTPFPDNSFDIVTVGYGLRNLANWEAGVAEMVRVAKPDGRILVLDFGKPENRLWRAIYFGYLRLFVPLLGLVFCGTASAYAYILESLKHYPVQQGVDAKMRELGLTEVRIVSFLGGIMTINYAQKPA